tara:strand:- start:2178 stop:3164 length:987 start_codon:yes stop_codon:yes gene_type:complete
MAIKTSGALSLKDDIAGEFGDAADHKMSEFYRFGKHVPGENVPPAIDGAWSNAQYRFDGTTTAQYYVTKSWIGTLDTTLTPSVTSWVWDTPITIESNSTATTLQTSTHDYRIGTLQFSSPFGGDLVGVFETYSIERRLSSNDSIVRSTLNLDVPTSGEISFSDLYAASDAVAVTSAISAFSTADFVGLSTNTAAPGAGLSSRTVLRETFTNPYGGASISIPEITVTIKGMYNAGSNGFFGFYGSAATSSTIANPHIKLITPDGSELYFGGVIASNATNEATNHVISASTINNQPAGDYTMAFEADCARSGDSQHSWATSAFTVTMSIS